MKSITETSSESRVKVDGLLPRAETSRFHPSFLSPSHNSSTHTDAVAPKKPFNSLTQVLSKSAQIPQMDHLHCDVSFNTRRRAFLSFACFNPIWVDLCNFQMEIFAGQQCTERFVLAWKYMKACVEKPNQCINHLVLCHVKFLLL